MKIEVGESLMRSWLRHIKGCQFAELNWKPSSSWPVSGDQQPLMDSARKYFKSELGIEIFGNQKASQVLKQAEIDVLGIQLKLQGEIDSIYTVDMAFHEGSLNYGGVKETRNRVLKKLIRSTMIIQSVFGSLPHQMVFASPEVAQPTELELRIAKQVLERFLSDYGIPCKVLLFMNDSFRDEVLGPIIGVADDVADTSELFLRSYQLLRIFPAADPAAAPCTMSQPDAVGGEVLRFEFDPNPPDVFKAHLLETKMAMITIHYQDGHNENRIWNASNFRKSSNLLGNLRSRPNFLKGKWQMLGISWVSLKIIS